MTLDMNTSLGIWTCCGKVNLSVLSKINMSHADAVMLHNAHNFSHFVSGYSLKLFSYLVFDHHGNFDSIVFVRLADDCFLH
jgi:hypothetical protein